MRPFLTHSNRKTAPYNALKPRFNRQPMSRYTSQSNAILRACRVSCIIFIHLYRFFTSPLYKFFTPLRVRVQSLTDF